MRPERGDYPEYYDRYMVMVESGDIVKVMENQLQTTGNFFNSITEEQGDIAYAEGKWTVKEVIGHVNDTERIMAYRALAIARGEKKSLPGFEQDEYVANSNFTKRILTDLIEEYRTLRASNIILFNSFTENELSKKGYANESEISVLSLAFIIAGHELHHIKILKERYLKVLD
jgi:hypothetical protein